MSARRGRRMLFRQLFDNETSTYTYLVADEVTKEAYVEAGLPVERR